MWRKKAKQSIFKLTYLAQLSTYDKKVFHSCGNGDVNKCITISLLFGSILHRFESDELVAAIYFKSLNKLHWKEIYLFLHRQEFWFSSAKHKKKISYSESVRNLEIEEETTYVTLCVCDNMFIIFISFSTTKNNFRIDLIALIWRYYVRNKVFERNIILDNLKCITLNLKTSSL